MLYLFFYDKIPEGHYLKLGSTNDMHGANMEKRDQFDILNIMKFIKCVIQH